MVTLLLSPLCMLLWLCFLQMLSTTRPMDFSMNSTLYLRCQSCSWVLSWSWQFSAQAVLLRPSYLRRARHACQTSSSRSSISALEDHNLKESTSTPLWGFQGCCRILLSQKIPAIAVIISEQKFDRFDCHYSHYRARLLWAFPARISQRK